MGGGGDDRAPGWGVHAPGEDADEGKLLRRGYASTTTETTEAADSRPGSGADPAPGHHVPGHHPGAPGGDRLQPPRGPPDHAGPAGRRYRLLHVYQPGGQRDG